MSSSIDQRIVKMEFDNRQFESGIKTSLSSLDRLKRSLNLSSSVKNLNALKKAGDSFQLAQLQSTVEQLSAKFSKLGVIGMTALQNITNSAVNAGKRMIKALTIEPITTGFQEYETQINATQTILANTQKEGATIKDVNKALDELNKYADLTIYNFTEMTRNIGTFTAAGVKLDTSVNAIQGIANLAAVSGSTSQQASTAMYQLSQALASGTVKLMDWNSVVNAGMGGQVFQDALMETARVHGVAIDSMIKKEGSFRETLQHGWLTSEILTETLQHFTTFTDEYNEKTLKAQGYTDKQIAAIKKMGITATDAATKVKTFTQLWDVLKEAAQSGWSQSWRIIVGDFEQAKSTLTEFSDVLTNVINESSQSRIDLLNSGLSSGFEQMLSMGIADREGYIESIKKVAKEHGVAVDDMIKKSGSFEDSLKEGWLTSDILKESLVKLTKKTEGYSEKQLKNLGYTEEQVAALSKLNEEVQNGSINVDELSQKIGRMSGRENLMKSLMNVFQGLLSIIKPIKEAFTDIFPPMTGEQLYNITAAIQEFTSKLIISENTANKIKGVFSGLFSMIKPFIVVLKFIIKSAAVLISSIAPPLINAITTILGYVGSLLTKIQELWKLEDIYNYLYRNAAKLSQKVSEGLALLGEFFGYLTKTVTGVDVRNFEEVEAVLEALTKRLKKLRDTIIEVVKALVKGKPETSSTVKDLQKGFNKLSSDSATAVNKIVEFAKKVKAFFAPAIKSIKSAFTGVTITDLIGSGLLTGIFVAFKKLTKEVGGFGDAIKDVLGAAQGALESYQNTLKANTLLKIGIAVTALAVSLSLLTTIDSARLKTGLIGISVLLGEVVGILWLLSSDMMKLDFAKTSKAALSMVILSVAISTLADALAKCKEFQEWDKTWPALAAMITLMSSLTGTAIALGKWGGNTDIVKASVGILIFAFAIKKLATSIKTFSKLDSSEIKKGLFTLAAMLTEISLFIRLTELSNLKDAKKNIIEIAVSMIILYQAVKLFGTMEPTALIQGLTVITTVMGALVITLQGMSGLNIAGTSRTILALAFAITALTIPISILGHMKLFTLAKGLISLGAALGMFSIAIGIMKGASGNLVGVAPALLAMTVALTALAIPIKIFASMSLISIAVGLGAMFTSLMVLAAGAQLVSGASIALASLAKSILAIGLGALGVSLAIGAITVALVTLATLGAGGIAAILASLTGLLYGLTAMMPLVGKFLTALISTVLKTIKDTGPLLIETVITLIDGLITAVANHAESIVKGLIKVAFAIIKAFLSILCEYVGPFIKAGLDLAAGFVKGIGQKMNDIWNKGKEAVKKFIYGIKFSIKRVIDIGRNLIEGFIQGIKDKIKDTVAVAKSIGKTVINKFKDVLGIHSPSKVMMEIAKYTVEGFIKGLQDNQKDLENAAGNVMSKSVIDSITNQMATLMATMSYGKKAFASFISGFGDLSNEVNSASSFTAAKAAIEDYAKTLYLESDAYTENKKKVEELKASRDDLKKQIEDTKKKIEEYSKSSSKNSKERVKEYKNELKNLKSNLKDTKVELKTAKLEITEGTKEFVANQKAAFEDLNKSISDSVKNSIDPMSASLDTQIDLFKKFGSEAEEILSSDIISNMESQVEGISKWNAQLEELSRRGFAKGLLDQLKSMGPSASNYIQAFMTMTNEQMLRANEVFAESSKLTSEALLNNFKSSLETAKQWASDLAELATRGLNQGMIEQLGKAGTSSSEYVDAFMSMTASQLGEFNKSYAEYLKLPDSVASSVMATFAYAGTDAAQSFSKDLMTFASPESEQNQKLVSDMKTTGKNMVTGLKQGAESKKKDAKSSATSIGKAVYNGFNTYISNSSGSSLGYQMCSGLVSGLEAGRSMVVNAAVRTAVAAYRAACEALEIKSPSRKFMEIGKFADMGMAEGFRKYTVVVKKSAEDVGEESMGAFQAAVSKIAEVLNSDMDSSPTIRPVLDMSELKSGIHDMNSMLSGTTIDIESARIATAKIANQMNSQTANTPQEIQNGKGGNVYTFTQNNYSPKALSRLDIYRQTKNQFSAAKGALGV